MPSEVRRIDRDISLVTSMALIGFVAYGVVLLYMNDRLRDVEFVLVSHHPEPRPLIPVLGACCLVGPDGKQACFTVTKEKCEDRNGDYLGDNVACNPEPCE